MATTEPIERTDCAGIRPRLIELLQAAADGHARNSLAATERGNTALAEREKAQAADFLVCCVVVETAPDALIHETIAWLGGAR